MSQQQSSKNHTKGPKPPARRTTNQSNTSTTFDAIRRRGTGQSQSSGDKAAKGPFQEHYSCYEGLTWLKLKGYLEGKWPHLRLTEQKV